MKKFLKISLCMMILFISTACGNNNDVIDTDAKKFKQEYEALNNDTVVMNIDENNPIKYVNFDEVIDILSSGTGIIYFGFPGCPWCRNIIPVLFEMASTNNIDTIYYFNPSNIRSNNDENYKKLVNILSDYLMENDNGEKTLYVPDVYFIRNGEIVGHHLSTVDSQTSPYTPLTKEQGDELKNIYQELFNNIK